MKIRTAVAKTLFTALLLAGMNAAFAAAADNHVNIINNASGKTITVKYTSTCSGTATGTCTQPTGSHFRPDPTTVDAMFPTKVYMPNDTDLNALVNVNVTQVTTDDGRTANFNDGQCVGTTNAGDQGFVQNITLSSTKDHICCTSAGGREYCM